MRKIYIILLSGIAIINAYVPPNPCPLIYSTSDATQDAKWAGTSGVNCTPYKYLAIYQQFGCLVNNFQRRVKLLNSAYTNLKEYNDIIEQAKNRCIYSSSSQPIEDCITNYMTNNGNGRYCKLQYEQKKQDAINNCDFCAPSACATNYKSCIASSASCQDSYNSCMQTAQNPVTVDSCVKACPATCSSSKSSYKCQSELATCQSNNQSSCASTWPGTKFQETKDSCIVQGQELCLKNNNICQSYAEAASSQTAAYNKCVNICTNNCSSAVAELAAKTSQLPNICTSFKNACMAQASQELSTIEPICKSFETSCKAQTAIANTKCQKISASCKEGVDTFFETNTKGEEILKSVCMGQVPYLTLDMIQASSQFASAMYWLVQFINNNLAGAIKGITKIDFDSQNVVLKKGLCQCTGTGLIQSCSLPCSGNNVPLPYDWWEVQEATGSTTSQGIQNFFASISGVPTYLVNRAQGCITLVEDKYKEEHLILSIIESIAMFILTVIVIVACAPAAEGGGGCVAAVAPLFGTGVGLLSAAAMANVVVTLIQVGAFVGINQLVDAEINRTLNAQYQIVGCAQSGTCLS